MFNVLPDKAIPFHIIFCHGTNTVVQKKGKSIEAQIFNHKKSSSKFFKIIQLDFKSAFVNLSEAYIDKSRT